VHDSVIHKILTTSTFAPSAHNRQPWRFAVIHDFDLREKLIEAMIQKFKSELENDKVSPDKILQQTERTRIRILSAPVLILLCLDMSEMNLYTDKKRMEAEHLMAVQSTAAAGLQLQLAAHAEGLASVWVCWPLYVQELINDVLGLPESWEPQGFFFIGYPDVIPDIREKKNVESITIYL